MKESILNIIDMLDGFKNDLVDNIAECEGEIEAIRVDALGRDFTDKEEIWLDRFEEKAEDFNAKYDSIMMAIEYLKEVI